MGQVNNYFYRWSCVPLEEQCTTHLNNNTPVNTEVLWGGGDITVLILAVLGDEACNISYHA